MTLQEIKEAFEKVSNMPVAVVMHEELRHKVDTQAPTRAINSPPKIESALGAPIFVRDLEEVGKGPTGVICKTQKQREFFADPEKIYRIHDGELYRLEDSSPLTVTVDTPVATDDPCATGKYAYFGPDFPKL